MKQATIYRRLLLPAMILLLLPPLSCLIFRQSAQRYAYAQAEKELQSLQDRIGGIMQEAP